MIPSPLNASDKIVVFASLALALLLYLSKKRRVRLPYPPGPKKLPLVGNLFDLPTSLEWETYARWGKEYDSDIIHLCAAGNDIIVINSYSVANDLFEKRSSNYSSRAQYTMIRELMGWDWLMSALVYGEPWRIRRRLFMKYFHPANTDLYQSGQIEHIRKMLPRLLNDPDDFLGITRYAIGAISFSLAYGFPIKDSNDPFIELAGKAAHSIAQAAVPGAFWVDMMPFLKYVPEFVPGAGFKKKARVWRKLQEDMRELPFKETLKNMASGVAKTSFTSTSLADMDESIDTKPQREAIRDTAGIVFAAGADTTLSGIHTLFVAMLCYPEVQKKAQQELDRVLRGRLPEFSDEPDLPYISALVKEITRWQVVTPIGVPHYTSEDDLYRGYHIPKGALVIGNSWAMLHDEKAYPDPSSFIPERFLKNGQLNPAVLDPSLMAFGFGRRICPGSHIALSVLWLTAATVISTFEISKALDEHGAPIEPSVTYKTGLICRPESFKCTIKARSKEAEELIRSAGDSY